MVYTLIWLSHSFIFKLQRLLAGGFVTQEPACRVEGGHQFQSILKEHRANGHGSSMIPRHSKSEKILNHLTLKNHPKKTSSLNG